MRVKERGRKGFNVPMDNSVLMAVVDAAEDLFHEDSCVTFSKLSSLQNLVKQFATLANSNKNEKGTFLLVFCKVLGCQKEKYLEFIYTYV